MNDNLLTTYNGIEIYKSDIDILVDEYEKLSNIDLEERLKKNSFFTGLMVYINRHLFKNIHDMKYNNDYKALDDIFFDCYVPLCERYGKTITLLSFSVMTGISNDSISQICNGTYKDGSKVNTDTFRIVKRWKDITELSMVESGSLSSNPAFTIFTLKARYGWRETMPEPAAVTDPDRVDTLEIVDRYRDTEKPVLPTLN